jgi:hypothetical protein
VKQGQPVTSGVYELLSTGQVLPSHRDHPSNRQLFQSSGCSRLKQQSNPQEGLLEYTFTTAGLQLQSSQFAVHGRCAGLKRVLGSAGAKGVSWRCGDSNAMLFCAQQSLGPSIEQVWLCVACFLGRC